MLHFSWNNHTVFQTPKGTPKLDNTSLPLPQLSPHAAPQPPPALQPTNPPATHSSPARIPWSPVLIWVETFWAQAWGGGEGGRRVDTREAGGEAVSTHSSFLIRTCLEFRHGSRWRACLFTVLLLSTLLWALIASSRSSDQSVSPINACCSVYGGEAGVLCVFSAIIDRNKIVCSPVSITFLNKTFKLFCKSTICQILQISQQARQCI